jgi:hypothetical protein
MNLKPKQMMRSPRKKNELQSLLRWSVLIVERKGILLRPAPITQRRRKVTPLWQVWSY